ncbi:SH2 domain-containing protein 3C [Larimichthys crocea]|uniref:Uncharacterized protein n=1 Tax=Larimichthys crocea TaxID=215358 RepID=A0ACD3Q7R5_LARCR|nr:SH2 domain-containing protein 3C [Larimichthys crocea]
MSLTTSLSLIEYALAVKLKPANNSATAVSSEEPPAPAGAHTAYRAHRALKPELVTCTAAGQRRYRSSFNGQRGQCCLLFPDRNTFTHERSVCIRTAAHNVVCEPAATTTTAAAAAATVSGSLLSALSAEGGGAEVQKQESCSPANRKAIQCPKPETQPGYNHYTVSMKWFGSITNLSIRRSEKANTKAATEHDGILNSIKSAAGGQSVDDMGSGPLNSSYACSTEMYTHVGTVPRNHKKKKSCKGLKEKKKKKEEEEEEEKEKEGGSQTGEHVRDSPLLGALSSLSLPSLDHPLPVSPLARPLPATPAARRASPLTSASENCSNDPSADPVKRQEALSQRKDALVTDKPEKEPSNMATNGQTALLQNVYVRMDPVTEAAPSHVDNQTKRQRVNRSKQETIKAENSSEAESIDSLQDLKDSGGEYVKFSKDKFWLEPPSEKLRKQLEEELKLSGTNLKSHAWYHGRIPWEVSESLVVNHGDFLIRDSQSSQGDFVLTSHWEQKTLHFLIKKTVVQSGETYTRVQYSLEDEAFDSLPALVHFYVGSRAALTQWSGTQIHQPVNRTLPLSHLETAFCTAVSHRGLQNNSVSREDRVCPRSPSSLHHREADVNKEQDDRLLPTAGESSLSTVYNSEFNTKLNSLSSKALFYM